jgi:protein-S-isoprenylcysteine O-methyltransferase Ste14
MPATRIVVLVTLLVIALAFGVNAVRQKNRSGRTSLRRPDRRRPAVWLGDVLFWIAVAVWAGSAVAFVVWPLGRASLHAWSGELAPAMRLAGAVVLLPGLAAILWGFASLGLSFRTSIDYGERIQLVTRGVYRHSRNPMAAGLILVGWGTAMMVQSVPSVLAALGLTLANLLRVHNEEAFLRGKFGSAYERYRREVPRFLGLPARGFRTGLLLVGTALYAGGSTQALVESKSGVEYPDTVVVETPAGPVTLVATGAGLREKTVLNADVYTVVSYIEDSAELGRPLAAAILTLDAPKRLQMDMRRHVGHGKLEETLTTVIHANVEDHASIARDLATFFAYFPDDAQDSDEIVFDYVPGVGLTTRLNGEKKGVIENFAFVTALWSVWFGEHPEDGSLQRALVSQVK